MKVLGSIAFFVLVLFPSAKGQDFMYTITTDTIAYNIGANINVTQEWSYPKDKSFEAPELPPSLGKLELVLEQDAEKEEIDGKWRYRKKAIYTCFDTGYYQVPPLAWKAGEDSVFSNSLIFKISLIEVDTTKDIKDIEPPIAIPYTFKEVFPYVAWSVGGLAAIAAIIILLVRRKKNIVKQEPPKRPAYIVAYEKLEELKARKLWEKGQFKDYHFTLSAIVREYIQEKYDVTTQELTTDELMILCATLDIPEDLLNELKATLQLGDFAKFAKANPSPEQNEDAWNNVHGFISKTHVTPSTQEEKDAG